VRSPPSSLSRGSFVPDMWRPLAPDTLKNLSGWIEHFESRYRQYIEWVAAEPAVMWLSGLHLPEAYLAALVQVLCAVSTRTHAHPPTLSVLHVPRGTVSS